MADWVITLPQKVEWSDYKRELDDVLSTPGMVMNYRVARFPKDMRIGDRCFVVHRGKVRGWMKIVGMKDWPNGFTCQTTGAEWRPGKYIQRAGTFMFVDGPEMKGFQGIRRYHQGVSC